jgi:hypothetical protein
MKLEACPVGGVEIDIHPASRRREWMDETPGAFAYRCLPLSIANSHGWEIRCPFDLEAEWNGGSEATDVRVEVDGDPSLMRVAGHFGSGILTFSPHVIFRTSPGYNLWVTGPANHFKDGVQPLSAVVETDWMPFTFTMNWKLTRPGLRVRFEKGEPFCLLFPVQRGVLERIEPEFIDIASDDELRRQFECAKNRRGFVQGLKLLRGASSKAHEFQQWYMRGMLPDQSGRVEGHEKTLTLKPFRRAGEADAPPGSVETSAAVLSPEL